MKDNDKAKPSLREERMTLSIEATLIIAGIFIGSMLFIVRYKSG